MGKSWDGNHLWVLGTELEPTWKDGNSVSIVGSVNSIVLSAMLRMCFRELSVAISELAYNLLIMKWGIDGIEVSTITSNNIRVVAVTRHRSTPMFTDIMMSWCKIAFVFFWNPHVAWRNNTLRRQILWNRTSYCQLVVCDQLWLLRDYIYPPDSCCGRYWTWRPSLSQVVL